MTHKLEDCLSALIDYRGKTPAKTDSGVPLITAKIVKTGRIGRPTEFISEADYPIWMRRGFPEMGDIVLTTEAPLGEVGQIRELPVGLAQRVVTLRGKENLLDNGYLLYALQSEQMQARLRDRSSGTTVLGIKQSELRKVEIELPPFEYQKAITDVLGCLDDRIDLLRQTNATLEAIAQALFKSWFVDFDPVHAKAEGREPEAAAQGCANAAQGRMPIAAMDAATAALFPSEFEESELGLIPKGWSVKRLSDLVELAYGKALKASDRVAGEIPVYGSGGVTGWHDVALVKEPTIIVGRKGSVGTIYWEDRPCHPIDTVFFVRSQKVPLTLCLQVLRSLGLDKMNTDAAVPGLNRENAYRLEVVAAPTAVNDAWNKIAEPIYVAMSNNSRRCEVLSQLRDTLLPRLISGKLRLPEIMETAKEAFA